VSTLGAVGEVCCVPKRRLWRNTTRHPPGGKDDPNSPTWFRLTWLAALNKTEFYATDRRSFRPAKPTDSTVGCLLLRTELITQDRSGPRKHI
jgi:hypothetical protein